MKITVSGSVPTAYAGAFWPSIEQMVAAMCGYDGKLTRISRPDGSCDYRAHGQYELTFTARTGDDIPVSLELK